MARHAWANNSSGFTLIEVLVAMLVLLLGLLGILMGITKVLEVNIENTLRNEAVKVAQERLEELRNTAYASIASGTVTVQRQVRKSTRWSFTVVQNVSSGSYVKVVSIQVQWNYRGTNHNYGVRTVIRRP